MFFRRDRSTEGVYYLSAARLHAARPSRSRGLLPDGGSLRTLHYKTFMPDNFNIQMISHIAIKAVTT